MKEPLYHPHPRVWSSFPIPDQLLDVLVSVRGYTASSFHDDAERLLRQVGSVHREYHVSKGHGQKGRIDLILAIGPQRIGIELDNRSPRGNSLVKLQLNFENWIVLCRER